MIATRALIVRSKHLVVRFFDGVRSVSEAESDRRWALGKLTEPERELWQRMTERDRVHSIAVARSASAQLGSIPVETSEVVSQDVVIAAALLHDVGKIDAQLGLLGRVAATLASLTIGSRLDRFRGGEGLLGRVARYCDYPRRGATTLEAVGSHPLVAAWAREHHEPDHSWTVPITVGRILQSADDTAR